MNNSLLQAFSDSFVLYKLSVHISKTVLQSLKDSSYFNGRTTKINLGIISIIKAMKTIIFDNRMKMCIK